MTGWLTPSRPLSIAHRGASAYAPENTLAAFALATDLGADMWEVDLHQTADSQIFAFHDFTLPDGRNVSSLSYAEIRAAVGEDEAPLLSEIIALARARACGIYADIKAPEASVRISEMLEAAGIEQAILGAFDPGAVKDLRAAQTPYPLASLIPVGADPFAVSPDAEHHPPVLGTTGQTSGFAGRRLLFPDAMKQVRKWFCGMRKTRPEWQRFAVSPCLASARTDQSW